MSKDTFDAFKSPDRGRFGDNESEARSQSPTKDARSNLCDVDVYLHHDKREKKAIAVSLSNTTPFAQWIWLPRSMIEYELTGLKQCRVTLPESFARDKGLI